MCARVPRELHLELPFAEHSSDGRSRGGWVVHLDHQLSVALVPKPDHNSPLWIMHVPEHALAILIERARRDYPRNVDARSPDALVPLSCDFRIGLRAHHVSQRDLQAALERPQLVHALDVDDQCAPGEFDVGHGTSPFPSRGLSESRWLEYPHTTSRLICRAPSWTSTSRVTSESPSAWPISFA